MSLPSCGLLAILILAMVGALRAFRLYSLELPDKLADRCNDAGQYYDDKQVVPGYCRPATCLTYIASPASNVNVRNGIAPPMFAAS
jgi:hypothetical protein